VLDGHRVGKIDPVGTMAARELDDRGTLKAKPMRSKPPCSYPPTHVELQRPITLQADEGQKAPCGRGRARQQAWVWLFIASPSKEWKSAPFLAKSCSLFRRNAKALVNRDNSGLWQGEQMVGDPAISDEDIAKTVAALEYAAAKRGLYLTVHALNRAREVLRWESAGDREKALSANRGIENETKETVLSLSPQLVDGH
jgi:hypothetical protein